MESWLLALMVEEYPEARSLDPKASDLSLAFGFPPTSTTFCTALEGCPSSCGQRGGAGPLGLCRAQPVCCVWLPSSLLSRHLDWSSFGE